ncbi:MAG TPA: ATP-binding protein [Verrucomicrobiae bacterium]|nr:ATP-binding protein [Verrucomicrobiae bacterium]
MLEELSLHILDIGMNSLAAGAKNLEVIVIENSVRDWLIIRIRDDGRGMDEKTLGQVLNQNATTKRNRKKPIGLGLALLRQTSEMCGGTFHVHSTPGRGTSVTASMRLSHIDRPPLGDLNSTIIALCANPDVGVQLHYRTNDETFHFSSKEGKPYESRRTQEAQGKGATSGCAA